MNLDAHTHTHRMIDLIRTIEAILTKMTIVDPDKCQTIFTPFKLFKCDSNVKIEFYRESLQMKNNEVFKSTEIYFFCILIQFNFSSEFIYYICSEFILNHAYSIFDCVCVRAAWIWEILLQLKEARDIMLFWCSPFEKNSVSPNSIKLDYLHFDISVYKNVKTLLLLVKWHVCMYIVQNHINESIPNGFFLQWWQRSINYIQLPRAFRIGHKNPFGIKHSLI